MKGKVLEPLNAARKFVLDLAGALMIGVPLFVGFVIAPQSRAPSQSTAPAAFEAASVKLNKNPEPRSMRQQIQPGGRYSATAVPLRFLISLAYAMPFQSPRITWTPEFNAAVS